MRRPLPPPQRRVTLHQTKTTKTNKTQKRTLQPAATATPLPRVGQLRCRERSTLRIDQRPHHRDTERPPHLETPRQARPPRGSSLSAEPCPLSSLLFSFSLLRVDCPKPLSSFPPGGHTPRPIRRTHLCAQYNKTKNPPARAYKLWARYITWIIYIIYILYIYIEIYQRVVSKIMSDHLMRLRPGEGAGLSTN